MIRIAIRPDMVIDALQRVGFEVSHTLPAFTPSQTPIAYGRHSIYYTLACRGRAVWATHNSGSLAVVSQQGIIGPAFASDAIVIVRPEIRNPKVFAGMLLDVARVADCRIIMKNVSSDEVSTLEGAGLRSYRSSEWWNEECQLDDQTFPDVVLELARDREPRHSGDEFEFHVVSAETIRDEALSLYRRWRGWYLRRHPKWNTSAFQSFYDIMFRHEVFGASDVCAALRQGRLLRGFCLGSMVGVDQLDLWIALTDYDPVGLSGVLFSHLRHALKGLGIRYLGLGGSEEMGLHRFKTRLGPHTLFVRSHMVVEPPHGRIPSQSSNPGYDADVKCQA